MTRNFRDRPIDPQRLVPIFRDALRAPSAGFTQAVEFLVLTAPDRRARFWDLVAEPGWRERSPIADGLMAAPVVALVLVDPEAYRRRYANDDKTDSALGGAAPAQWQVEYPTVDAGFAAMVVLLGVEAAGLGALFFHLQGREDAVLAGLGVPAHFATIGAVAIGEPAGAQPVRRAARPARRPATERIHYDDFGGAHP